MAADGQRAAWLPHVRAALIAVALLANVVRALPLASPVTEADLKEDWRQSDIEMWRGWLANAGLELTHEQIEEWLVKWTGISGTVRTTIRAPFDPLFDTLAIDQAWALFASASTKPDRLVVEARRGGLWTVLYRRLDPCCTWRDDQLRYRRIRGIWDGQKATSRPAYRHLTVWLSNEVFRDFPDAEAVRVELERTHTVYPWDEPDPKVELRHQRIHRRPAPTP